MRKPSAARLHANPARKVDPWPGVPANQTTETLRYCQTLHYAA
jgi:hypothetical protein